MQISKCSAVVSFRFCGFSAPDKDAVVSSPQAGARHFLFPVVIAVMLLQTIIL
jgi:hypothetical protein